jgi:hypothetical protein
VSGHTTSTGVAHATASRHTSPSSAVAFICLRPQQRMRRASDRGIGACVPPDRLTPPGTHRSQSREEGPTTRGSMVLGRRPDCISATGPRWVYPHARRKVTRSPTTTLPVCKESMGLPILGQH